MSATQLKRIPIHAYRKSGKQVCIVEHRNSSSLHVLELSSDLREIKKIRTTKYIKNEMVYKANYYLELLLTKTWQSKKEFTVSYTIFRVLTNEDIDEEKWKSTNSLFDLPVSSHPEITGEELIWAGLRKGNTEGGVLLSIFTVFTAVMLGKAVFFDGSIILWSILFLPSAYNLFEFDWRPSEKPKAELIAELKTHKEELRKQNQTQRKQALTEYENLLDRYSTWEQLSPSQFEHALCNRFEKLGFKLKVTQYSGDGGIDLSGLDENGNQVIIQAKKYSSNVGVSVVREMIGVRKNHPSDPRTMIVSLVGFTRGAKALASEEGIVLMS
jgi:restriction system protein